MDPPLTWRGSVRASDADRERTAAAVRRHYAAGRLDTDELEQRVSAVYASRWRTELRSVLCDMPFEPPQVDRTRVAGGVDRLQRGLLRLHAICWAVFNTMLLAIWAWGGGHGIWPVVAVLPTGALLAWHAKGSRAVSRRLASAGSSTLARRRMLA